jgi:hypothetical protein
MNAKQRKRVRQLHRLCGSDNEAEATTARRKLIELLRKHGKTWNDLDAILAIDVTPAQPPPDPRDAGADPPYATDITVGDLVRHVIARHVALEDHEYDAVALWAIHTHVYQRFMFTPRLLLSSPVKGCGKTTLLDILSSLVAHAHRSDSITGAVLYHCVNNLRSTMLLDEVDNLNLPGKDQNVLRTVLNSGYRRGGAVDRVVKNVPVAFTGFAPVALAGIGFVPPPLMSRSIIIRMQKHDDWRLLRFNRANADTVGDLDTVYRHVHHWCTAVQLNDDPAMPDELRGRKGDNWRPLIAIADAISAAWGERARAAAVKFAAAADHDEEPAIVLLQHLLVIFGTRAVLSSQVLVEALIDHDELWGAWRGARGNERPRKFTQGDLAFLLRPFRIRSGKIWLTRDPPKQARGYRRADLEAAWRDYCAEPGTAEQPNSRKYLRNVPLD